MHGILLFKLTLWFRDLCLLLGLGSNSFIGDRRNHISFVVTMIALLVVLINQDLNLIGPLAMTICMLHWGIDVVISRSLIKYAFINGYVRLWLQEIE
jgi:hypothetical protein